MNSLISCSASPFFSSCVAFPWKRPFLPPPLPPNSAEILS